MAKEGLTLSKVATSLVLISVLLTPTFMYKNALYMVDSEKSALAFAESLEDESSATTLYVPGRLLLKFNADLPEHDGQNILRQQGAIEIEEIPHTGIKILKVPENAINKIQLALQQNENVKFVEKDLLFMPQELTINPVIPNDPYFSKQWHLTKIGAPSVWNITKGTDTLIAILDSGVEPTHPDLASKLVAGYNFYNNNDDWSDIACKHGTVVAGVAASTTDNGIGVASVAWDSKIMPLRVTDDNCYGSLSAISKAIVYAADNGARVANVSFRIPNPSTVSSLADAYNYMYYNKGGFVVIAAGNDGAYLDVNDTPEVIHVGSTEARDYLTAFSNHGPFVDFVAPGQALYSSIWNGQYNYVSGTSVSAPVVSGVVALMFAANSGATPAQVYGAIKETAADVTYRDDGSNIVSISTGPDDFSGWGRIDAYRALQKISTEVALDSISPTLTVSGDMIVEAAGPSGSAVTYPPATATDNVAVVSGPFCNPLSGFVFPIGSTMVTCLATDAAGNTGSASFMITVTDSKPPIVKVPADMAVATTSPEGSIVTFSTSALDVVDGSITATCNPASGSLFPIGDTMVVCQAIDSQGNVGYSTFHVNVVLDTTSTSSQSTDTTPPTVSVTNPVSGAILKGTVTISVQARDESGISKIQIFIDNKLKSTLYSASFDYGWNTKGIKDGQHMIKVTAYDLAGNSESVSIIVQVSNARSK